MKGDQADGVPNVLSGDDVFVEGIRQTPLRKKIMEDMIDKGNAGRKDRNYRTRYRPPKFVTKKLKGRKEMNPGSLIAKIGKQVYAVGKKGTFRAENSGILYLGPFEWDAYNDNSGYLSVTIEVSDK